MTPDDATRCLADVLLTGLSPLASPTLCQRLSDLVSSATILAATGLWDAVATRLCRAYLLLGVVPPSLNGSGYLWAMDRHPIQLCAHANLQPRTVD